ncbi:shufflon system plasmid conjugative transfer pilus tip adhesin PilV [Xanthomonas hydrangeae]|uniref:shufflon system plasmid conjugative transfer pilus tip adhesin PilV n=1 Tax=Xanthomonas hydrangeae TaxID=2775159 RepID=UPI001964FCC3
MSTTSRRSQVGMTMLELLVVLALSAGLAASLIGWWNWRATSQRDDLAAQHAQVVMRAAQSYIRNNYQNLYNNTGGGPVTVPASALQLGDGMATTNAYGQTFALRLIRSGTSMEGLVLYTGGQTIKISSLRAIANQIGLAGGYVSPDEPNTAVGMMRQWTKSLAAYGGNLGTGKVAVGLFVEEMAQAADDYLHRTATAGKPELNRMSTAIEMNANNLNNAGAVNANRAAINGVTVSDGGLATAALSISKSSFGEVPYPEETIQYRLGTNLRIYEGENQRLVFDGDQTNKFSGSLTSNSNIQAAGNLIAGAHVIAAGTLSGQELSVNEAYTNNYFRVRGSGGLYWEDFGGGWYMGDSNWIRAYGNKNIYTAGEVRGGSVTAEGRLAANDLMLNAVANAGGGCAASGLQARSSTGMLLSCVSGVWRAGGGIQGTTIIAGPGESQGPVWAYAVCPAGTYLVGGGYNVSYMEKASSQEAPQVNRPAEGMNAWAVYSGSGAGYESRFMPFAICAW